MVVAAGQLANAGHQALGGNRVPILVNESHTTRVYVSYT
jgi:hypothetical protein